jgi:glycosyltransferase involved in cell wall biosynthesis
MKVSFVIPAHNEEAYLGRCLSSIFKELEGKNYSAEVIVVNNASTDGTEKIGKSFKEVIVVNEPKKGLPCARQAGFEASSGDLIANLDADTIMSPGWIDKIFEEFSQDQELVALSGPFIYHDLPKVANFPIKIFFYLGSVFNFLGQRFFRTGAILQGGNFVVRRFALEKIGGYNLKLDFFGEDTDVARRIGKVGKVKFTPKLPIYSSGRRLKAEGIFKIALYATLDNIWIMFLRRPFRKGTARDIRL